MDKILDRDVYVLFRNNVSNPINPFNPNFKKIQHQQLQEFNQLGIDQDSSPTEEETSASSGIDDLTTRNSTTSANAGQQQSLSSLKYAHQKFSSNAIDSLSSGWEESENESPNLSNDVSLLETKYRCLTLKQQKQQTVFLFEKYYRNLKNDFSLKKYS
jgi:hypothetical protein